MQRAITAERYERKVGRSVRCLVDRAATADGPATARAPWQADDIDGIVFLDRDATPGSFVENRMDAVEDDYDFRATVLRVTDEARERRAPDRARRVLPIAASTTIGSFGR